MDLVAVLTVKPLLLEMPDVLSQNASLLLTPEPVTLPTCVLSIFCQASVAWSENTAQSPTAHSVIPSKFVLPAVDTI